MTIHNTVLLNPNTWEFMLDSAGNIAIATHPYSIAQDVASACKLFYGELWYNTGIGVPYFEQILGKVVDIAVLKNYLIQAALTVPGVVKANVVITGYNHRELQGVVQFIDENGTQGQVSL